MVRKANVILFCLLFFAAPAAAQQEDAPLSLRLRRDFGYGSGVQVQGRFSYRVDAPETVERVEFLLDGEVIGEDREAPFRLTFSTGNYPDGWHTLSVVGITQDGERLASNEIRREFVPQQQAFTFVGAILLLVVGVMVARYLLTRPRGSDATNGKRRGYGLLGGAICPRCGRPFSLPVWSINLMAGRIARCPHCGKWSFVQRASPGALARAEEFERELDAEANGAASVPASDDEKLRRRLDDSRYDR